MGRTGSRRGFCPSIRTLPCLDFCAFIPNMTWLQRNPERRIALQRAQRAKDPARVNKLRRAWNKRNPDKVSAHWRKTVYGITAVEFGVMMVKQGNRCAICKTSFDSTPCVDHDHNTGKVRGLLCRACNSALGLLKDSHANLLAAIQYLHNTK